MCGRIMAMQINKPEEKKLFFNKKQIKAEKGKTRAGRCIYSADALCFSPEKRYKLCDDCPRIKDKDKNEKALYKKIVGNAIQMLGQEKNPPPSTYDLKL